MNTGRGRLGLIVFFAVALWGGEYVRRDLWEPDEARYAYIAREMRDSGEWLIPHRHGEYYAHKPPLMFWLINVFSFLTGGVVGGVATRLPSLLGGILTMWALARVADLWGQREAAWRAILILCTSYLFWHEVGMGQIDALLCGLEMATLALLLAENGHPTFRRPAAAYACMGLAVLAKGPVGFLVPLGTYVAVTLAAGEGRWLRRFHWCWGPVITLLFPGLWLLLVLAHGAPPGYFHELLLGQTVGRAGGEFGHRQPFYYFLAYFPLDFLPWTLFLPAAVAALIRRSDARLLVRRAVVWILFVLVFFSLSVSKRNLYTLLVYPAASLLVAAGWEHLGSLAPRWTRPSAYLMLAMWLVGGCGCIAIAAGLVKGFPFDPAAFWPVGVGMLVAVVVAGRLFMREGVSVRWLCTTLAVLLLLQFGISVWVYPAFNPVKTPVALAKAAQSKVPAGGHLLIYGMDGEILALYAERPGRRVDSLPGLFKGIREEKSGIAVFSAKDWAEVRRSLRMPTGAEHFFRMGGKKLVWVEYRAPPAPPSS
jgi:4-amino-4-deoxy-L-arabinose transferase-like glycosyltransferase